MRSEMLGTVYFLSAEGCGSGELARAEKSKLSPEVRHAL